MTSGYCFKCQNFSQNPISYDGNLYCQRCIGKVVPLAEEPSDEMIKNAEVVVPGVQPGKVRTQDYVYLEPQVNIPLGLQKKLLHASFYDTAEWMREMLDDDDFMFDLEKMAEMRLEENHPKYGSAMYAWSPDERFRNIMEEFADIFNYKSSEVEGE